jgi:hypothetical protein
MRPRRSVPLVLSCAAVALAGCGGSSLLDGSTASDLQDSLGKVQSAIDDGRCAQARQAASDGARRVDDLPSSVDAGLRDRLKTGFDELSSRVGTDCESTTTTTQTTETTDTTPTDVTPTATTPTTTPSEPTTTPDTPTTPQVDPPDTGTTDPGTGSGPGSGSDDGQGDDGSGGVVPGVDGPGASERSAPGQRGKELKKRMKELRKRAEQYFKGNGGG